MKVKRRSFHWSITAILQCKFAQIFETCYNIGMKLTAKVKLQTTPTQHQALLETLERANAACDKISGVAWETKTFNQFRLHGLTYYSIRETFSLSAQMVVRCISKVTDSYKLDRETKRTFNPHGSIAYDDRILKWYVSRQTVSLWTTQGRLTIPFLAGQKQLDLLKYQHGETDLGLVDGHFYLFATCEKETPEPIDVEGVLGVDLGIVTIAATSDGESYAGNQVNNVRHRHRRLRKKLQAKQTKSAKRRLKKLSGKEARFAKHTNHVISKKIVEAAKDTNRAIALEKLTGIRDRVTVRRGQRDNLHNWSFYQLKGFISYKAQLAGVPLIEVDPRNTSRECAACGHIDKANRKSQSSFLCVSCGYAANADHNAAVIISRRGAVNHPYISTTVATGSFNRSMAAVG
jgi:putative transposase